MRSPEPSRVARLWRSLVERVSRSSRVFLVGLVVACAVEVAVDWNSTLTDINVARATLRQKAIDYADIVRVAAEVPLASYDTDELDRLSDRLVDDREVVYVRFTDALGATLYDRLRPDEAERFARTHPGELFRTHYRHVMERDLAGMLLDPAALRDRMANSRHRDFFQAFTDGRDRLFAIFSRPEPPRPEPPRVLYQDRLADARHELDRTLTYSLGLVTGPEGDPAGVVLIAFSTDDVQREIRGRLWKGLAITVFFVALILVQNVLARRGKLHTLRLEAELGAARDAIRSSLPAVPKPAWGEIGVGFAQAESVGGTVWDVRVSERGVDVLIAVPSGAGVAAAFASLSLRDAFRRDGRVERDLVDDLAAVLALHAGSPLARDVAVLLVRLAPDGTVRGAIAGVARPAIVDAATGEVRPIAVAELEEGRARPPRLVAPLQTFSVAVPRGALLARIAGAASAAAQPLADDAIAEASRRWRGRATDDLLALVVRWS